MDLNLLENKIKKDPDANFDFFKQKWNEFVTLYEIIKLTPQVYNTEFVKLLQFITNTIALYNKNGDVDQLVYNPNSSGLTSSSPDDAGNIAEGRWLCLKLIELIKEFRSVMDGKMIRMVIKSTFTLRTKRQIDLETILVEWLELLDLNDKEQRKKLYNYIVKDLALLSTKSKNRQAVKKLQQLLFEKIHKNTNLNIRLLSCCIIIELYRRNIWNDLYTLNQLCELCKCQNPKIALSAIYFLLSTKNHYHVIFEAASTDSPGSTNTEGTQQVDPPVTHSLSHILDIYEPFKLVETLLERCTKNHFQYQHKLVALKLAAVVINKHKLTVPNFYSYLSKYLHHKQPLVTRVLLVFVISVYSGLDSGLVEPLVRKIVDDFIAYDRSDDMITIGVNTTREICNKLPEVLSEDTLNYLVEFKNYKSKNVSASVKSLINTYRKLDPKKLNKASRGKDANIQLIQQKRKLNSLKREDNPHSPRSHHSDDDSGGDYDDELHSDSSEYASDGDVDSLAESDDVPLSSDGDEVEEYDSEESIDDGQGEDQNEEIDDDDEVPDLVPVSDTDIHLKLDHPKRKSHRKSHSHPVSKDGSDADLDSNGDSNSFSATKDDSNPDSDSQGDSDADSDSESDSDSIADLDESMLLYTSSKKRRSRQKLQNKIASKRDRLSSRKLAQSRKGSKQSLTNKIKQRNKPLLMTLQSKRVKQKRNISVSEQMSRLKRHIKGLNKGNMKKKQRRHH
ncbi:hypothetical protein MACK_002320 [Theileria orientalis]|uniref:Protein SDA1 n=1 Tax=Theileria orientalis TaxID=68886 RepID=A0A976MC35_THEOR|nr:hypothetical protein MACK_002320 [Theileria orientalis]